MGDRILVIMILFGIFFALLPLPVFAYLDPGTGSLIIHMIVGALVGVSYTVRVFWANIKSLFRKLFGRKSDRNNGTSARNQ